MPAVRDSNLTSPVEGSTQSRARRHEWEMVAAPEATILTDQRAHPTGTIGSRQAPVLWVGVNHSLRAPQVLVLPRARRWGTPQIVASRRVWL